MSKLPRHHDNEAASESEDDLRASKSQRKREAHATTKLGRQLVELGRQQLAAIPLPDDIVQAVNEARAMSSHGARKRQILFLGKLLRQIDTQPIAQAVTEILAPGRRSVAQAQAAERWRDQLLNGGDPALNQLLREYPDANRQHLRQLMRQAGGPAESQKARQAQRNLYRSLHDLLCHQTANKPPTGEEE